MTADTPAERIPGPGPLGAILADAALAAACYLIGYELRFESALPKFLPFAIRSLPLVVAAQVIALAAAGVYTRAGRRSPAVRLAIGAAAGSALGAALTRLVVGFEGIARPAFLVDFVLLTITALGWRGVVALRAGSRAGEPSAAEAPGMIDRAAEQDSFRATLAALVQYRALVTNLVLKDLKLKYRGSIFGFLWSLINPLVMIGVYTIAFKVILRVPTPGFVFLVLIGILAWTFFVNSAMMATGAIADNGGLLKSVFFPRAILPISTVLFNLAQYVLTILVFLPVMLVIFRIPPAAPMLVYPIFLALQVVFTIGVALMLATGTAFFRDIRHLLEIALAMMFWTTPIVYEWSQVQDRLRLPLLLSPMSPYVVAYKQMFFYREWPDLSVWLVASVYAFGAFAIGAALLLAFEDRFAEHV